MKGTSIFLFLLVFFAQQISAQKIERRLALVIGNGKYKKKSLSLSNPTIDADSMVRALKDCYFDVMPVVKNADLKKMQESILAFSRHIREGKYDVGLVFYAGHGININGINYFVPTDFDVSDKLEKYEAEARAKNACVSVENWLQGTLIEAGESGKTFILMSDACRDNPYRGITRSLSANPWTDSLNTKKLPSDFFSSYSASQGQKAKDQSTYIKSLLRHIRTKNISIETLFKQVNKDMASSNQAPQVVSKLTRDFYFMPDTMNKKTERTEVQSDIYKGVPFIIGYLSTYNYITQDTLKINNTTKLVNDCLKLLEINNLKCPTTPISDEVFTTFYSEILKRLNYNLSYDAAFKLGARGMFCVAEGKDCPPKILKEILDNANFGYAIDEKNVKNDFFSMAEKIMTEVMMKYPALMPKEN